MMAKATLLSAIAATNRGLLASQTDKQNILNAIASLENLNPTPHPVESHLINGDWRLLYTTSEGLLNLTKIPFYQLGQIYQCIRTLSNSVYNIAEFSGLPFTESIVSVAAKFDVVSTERVNVKFERSIIGFTSLIGYKSPGSFIQEIESSKKFTAIDLPINRQRQDAWLDITYLDEDLRISRGNQGSIFVLTKI
ncbi:MAG: PAP/fibrillin family protein [Cyanobacteria bacterium P01_A01_bin.84]